MGTVQRGRRGRRHLGLGSGVQSSIFEVELCTSALSKLRIRVGVAGVERSEPPVRPFRGLTSFDPGHPKI